MSQRQPGLLAGIALFVLVLFPFCAAMLLAIEVFTAVGLVQLLGWKAWPSRLHEMGPLFVLAILSLAGSWLIVRKHGWTLGQFASACGIGTLGVALLVLAFAVWDLVTVPLVDRVVDLGVNRSIAEFVRGGAIVLPLLWLCRSRGWVRD